MNFLQRIIRTKCSKESKIRWKVYEILSFKGQIFISHALFRTILLLLNRNKYETTPKGYTLRQTLPVTASESYRQTSK